MEISGKNIHGSPCSNGLFLNNNTYNFTADVSKLDKNGRYSFSGASNKKRCEAEIDLLLPKLKCTYDNDRCSFNNVYQPSLEEVKFMVNIPNMIFFLFLFVNLKLKCFFHRVFQRFSMD